jgi:hypothetical protein
MAKLSNDDLLGAFKEMTLLELSEFVKQFEETFGVSAAAPVAVAAGPVAGAGAAAAGEEAEEETEFDRRRRQEDPGHQGGPRAHQPRPEGGQGPGRLGAQAGARARAQGAGRQGQGPAGGRRRDRRAEVTRPAGEPRRPEWIEAPQR